MRGWAACHSASAFRGVRRRTDGYNRLRRKSVNIIDKTESKAAIDFERYRLRRFLAELPPEEIESHAEPLDLAAIAQALDGNPRAVHFHTVGPERHELDRKSVV